MKRIFFILINAILISSCVSNKQLTYFQGEPVSKNEIYKLNNSPYRLQINDILYIDIKANNAKIVSMFKTSETQSASANQSGGLYFTGYTIDRHGNIRMPFIGDINVLGYTEKETREKVETELGKFFKNPELIFVTVKLGGVNFLVTGEVGSPGTVNLMQNQVSIIDALANAGEITDVGNRKNIEVIRKTIDGVKKFTIDMTNMEVFNSKHFYIQPNDIIYVPPLKQKAWGTGTTGLQTFTTVVTVLSFLTSSILLIKNL